MHYTLHFNTFKVHILTRRLLCTSGSLWISVLWKVSSTIRQKEREEKHAVVYLHGNTGFNRC